ncbi:50S ribosomal protein L24 [Patescibacteria group bacterium]|nr:50S ribosomal protein L24 [Patescibacteria group bacterium]MBU4031031.1 50S ribosomal protein L24 [Patescibacteria group bacterium]
MKIKKGDTVLVITGKDKGKKSKVLEAFPRQNKAMVEGVNIVKKHRRAQKQGEKGQIVEIPRPLDSSNLKFVCPKCNQATRIGYKITGQEKNRTCKKCGQEV